MAGDRASRAGLRLYELIYGQGGAGIRVLWRRASRGRETTIRSSISTSRSAEYERVGG